MKARTSVHCLKGYLTVEFECITFAFRRASKIMNQLIKRIEGEAQCRSLGPNEDSKI